MLCPNCKVIIPGPEIATHTVLCYRKTTKCKICGEIIQKDEKKAHLNKFRDYAKLKELISQNNEDQVSNYFDHGVDANLFFPEDLNGWTPMHYAAKHGAMTVLLALISRGAGVDPPDQSLKTPLFIALENK